mmetsp:Transcript_26688/g.78571  ORF Transcript_26688/g.78571 Transcript_26688/m.78571 type:complete len:306 (+) Transcript_26688:154-1071(+)
MTGSRMARAAVSRGAAARASAVGGCRATATALTRMTPSMARSKAKDETARSARARTGWDRGRQPSARSRWRARDTQAGSQPQHQPRRSALPPSRSTEVCCRRIIAVTCLRASASLPLRSASAAAGPPADLLSSRPGNGGNGPSAQGWRLAEGSRLPEAWPFPEAWRFPDDLPWPKNRRLPQGTHKSRPSRWPSRPGARECVMRPQRSARSSARRALCGECTVCGPAALLSEIRARLPESLCRPSPGSASSTATDPPASALPAASRPSPAPAPPLKLSPSSSSSSSSSSASLTLVSRMAMMRLSST